MLRLAIKRQYKQSIAPSGVDAALTLSVLHRKEQDLLGRACRYAIASQPTPDLPPCT